MSRSGLVCYGWDDTLIVVLAKTQGKAETKGTPPRKPKELVLQTLKKESGNMNDRIRIGVYSFGLYLVLLGPSV